MTVIFPEDLGLLWVQSPVLSLDCSRLLESLERAEHTSCVLAFVIATQGMDSLINWLWWPLGLLLPDPTGMQKKKKKKKRAVLN